MKIAPFIIAFTLFALLSGCAVDKKELKRYLEELADVFQVILSFD